jgi:hypothetical protein
MPDFRVMLTLTDSQGDAMAKLHGCRICFVELQRIELANGTVMLFCPACDLVGEERHIAEGARGQPAGMARKPLKLVVNRPKTPPRIKFRIPGRKSLTA